MIKGICNCCLAVVDDPEELRKVTLVKKGMDVIAEESWQYCGTCINIITSILGGGNKNIIHGIDDTLKTEEVNPNGS